MYPLMGVASFTLLEGVAMYMFLNGTDCISGAVLYLRERRVGHKIY